MKIAVPIYGSRIAPRLSLAKEALIVEFQARTETSRERVHIAHLHPMQLPDFLASKGVTKVVAAGGDRYLQELLRLRNIDVIWGINGDADDVIVFYLGGGLQLGMGLCPPARGRRRRRFRGLQL